MLFFNELCARIDGASVVLFQEDVALSVHLLQPIRTWCRVPVVAVVAGSADPYDVTDKRYVVLTAEPALLDSTPVWEISASIPLVQETLMEIPSRMRVAPIELFGFEPKE